MPRGRPPCAWSCSRPWTRTGFVFFTNYESRKAAELAVNPRAALCFYWPSIGVQVRVEGGVERVTAPNRRPYFATRPAREPARRLGVAPEPAPGSAARAARGVRADERAVRGQPSPVRRSGAGCGCARSGSSSGTRASTACTTAPLHARGEAGRSNGCSPEPGS
jgi:hypothetical protein